MSGMPDMTLTSTCSGCSASYRQIIKNSLCIFERGENLLQNGILHFILDSDFVRNRVTKLEFTQTKNGLFWKGSGTKG